MSFKTHKLRDAIIIALAVGVAAPGVALAQNAAESDSKTPVSYTHLDVYKRQRVDHIRANNRDGVEAASRTAHEVDTARGADTDRDVTRGTPIASHLIVAGRKLRKTVATGGVNRDGSAESGSRIGNGNRIARSRLARDGTRRIGLGLDLSLIHI